MRALGLLLVLLAPLAAAHADMTDHGRAFATGQGDGEPTRLVAGCPFHVEGTVEDGWRGGRLLLMAIDEDGAIRVAGEAAWRADADGAFAVGPLEAGPGVFVAGVELDAEHGIYSEAFRVDCAEEACPREGCVTFRVSSAAQGPPRPVLALLLVLAGIAVLGVVVVWRG